MSIQSLAKGVAPLSTMSNEELLRHFYNSQRITEGERELCKRLEKAEDTIGKMGNSVNHLYRIAMPV